MVVLTGLPSEGWRGKKADMALGIACPFLLGQEQHAQHKRLEEVKFHEKVKIKDLDQVKWPLNMILHTLIYIVLPDILLLQHLSIPIQNHFAHLCTFCSFIFHRENTNSINSEILHFLFSLCRNPNKLNTARILSMLLKLFIQ